MPDRPSPPGLVELEHYGISSASVRLLHRAPVPELLDYLDLVELRGNGPVRILPDSVAESQGRPLLFIVNDSHVAQRPDEQQLSSLRKKLACRGDRAYLARLRPGELLVVPVSLEERTPEWQMYRPGTPEALTFFSRLAHGYYDGQGEPKEADYVFSAIFKLVWSVADRLAELRLKRSDVLSLMGRALFFRFLRDRGVVRDDDLRRIAPKAPTVRDCFADAANAAATCAWLDKTFNGDLLSISDDGDQDYFDEVGYRTGGRVFIHLSAIVRGEEPVGDANYQLPLGIPNFGAYDFAHVPVGLLSQVYERFAWKWEHATAKETSVHYTPRKIAATLVDEAFARLPEPHEARVLDPACGACVFLVLAFRRLYRERWQHTGKRPDTQAIRQILQKQLTGFDISDSALKLGALSLYLTAIELDPEPIPPEKLKFHYLRDKVLFNFRRKGVDPAEGSVSGSLGNHVGRRFDGKFDLVLSNPPWTNLKKNQRDLAHEMTRLSKAVLQRRGLADLATGYTNPDYVPDLPFLWKAMEWCRRDGRIAMALPSRTLFKQGEKPRRARDTIFKAIEVTGIINCSNLRKTDVWPMMDQPFMLFFARNRRPKPGGVTTFITPYTDFRLNGVGEMRIDMKSVHGVDVEATFHDPWLWKALTVGTPLDVDIIRKIRAAGGRALWDYWVRELHLSSSNGYQVRGKQPQQDATPLKELRNLDSTDLFVFIVDVNELEHFSRDTVCWPRIKKSAEDKLRIYRGPLALIKESPGPDRTNGWALLCLDDVAYNESFYGYSAASHQHAELLVRYLHLFVHSKMWLHYALMTSAKLGVERPNIDKMDVDEFPILPLEKLSESDRVSVLTLSRRLVENDTAVFQDLDQFFVQLYGLDHRDAEVIDDTLTVREPNDELGKRASMPTTAAERLRFRQRLESILRPFFKVVGEEPHVELWKPETLFLEQSAPFGLLLISTRGSVLPQVDASFQQLLIKLAEETGSTRIIHHLKNGIAVALLNQYRYWTPSRARLLGAELVREHLTVFES